MGCSRPPRSGAAVITGFGMLPQGLFAENGGAIPMMSCMKTLHPV
jgi:hypothetical protein